MTEGFEKNTFRHSCKIEVRFSDLDAFGHVNNARFLTYYEEARVKYFDEIVTVPVYWAKQGLILARIECDFRDAIKHGDELIVYTRCSRIGTKSFDLNYLIERKSKGKISVASTGMSVLVAFDYEKNSPMAIPQEWLRDIKKFEGII
ncbi:MAG: acyl-CoA thioesterase [Bacteroidia bacterium]